MIFTSYFAKLRNLPENVYPIAICLNSPRWYTGAEYRKLAPKYELVMQWKENHNKDYYIRRFNDEVLSKLDAKIVLNELQSMLPENIKCKLQSPIWMDPDYHIALICYEKPYDFCHRHLVSNWFRCNGYECGELKGEAFALKTCTFTEV